MDSDTWIKLIGIVVALAISIAVMIGRYNCCLDAGYTHDQCVYDIACSSGD